MILEYVCTDAEWKEAQAAHLHQEYGGGSKWRARLAYFGITGITFVLLFFRFKAEIAPEDRLSFLLFVGLIAAVILIGKQLTSRRKPAHPTRAEISGEGLVFDNGTSRIAILWSGFGQCLETSNLFVLLDRPKGILYPIPKRAFPDESAQAWFRAQANEPRSVTPPLAEEHDFAPVNGAISSRIALNLQLRYRDYLNHSFTSSRIRGMFIGIFLLMLAAFAFTSPSPDAVNPPVKVFFIMISILLPMLIGFTFLYSLLSWRGGKSYAGAPQQVLLNAEGIDFATSDSRGRLPWSTYKYYLENRWAFFIWDPRGSLWMMFPKRLFLSPSDLDQVRFWLRSNLQRSKWFFV